MKLSKVLSGLAAMLLAGSAAVSAQNSTLTPYSRYGYGILGDNATSAQRAMGGVGYAMNSGRQINVMNPASYAMCDSLTFLFDMGVDFTTLWQKESVGGKNLSEKRYGGGLDYITMQVPVWKGLGASLGVLPYSSVGYAFGNDIADGVAERQGSGSINQLYLGVGYRPFNGFALGVNFAYLFGNNYNDSYITTDGGSTTLFERQLEVRDWRMDIGLQYSRYIHPRHRLTAGIVYSPKKDMHGHAKTYSYDVNNQQDAPEEIENIPLKGNYSLSETWGVGLAYEYDHRLFLEGDFTYQPWSKTKYRGVEQDGVTPQLADRYKIAGGLQYTPRPRGSYLQRVQYRAGAFFNRDYLRIRNNNLREYGLSIGFGLPVPSFKTIVSLGVEWRHRQAYPNPLIKENYINLTLGINFNEMWFRKSRIY